MSQDSDSVTPDRTAGDMAITLGPASDASSNTIDVSDPTGSMHNVLRYFDKERDDGDRITTTERPTYVKPFIGMVQEEVCDASEGRKRAVEAEIAEDDSVRATQPHPFGVGTTLPPRIPSEAKLSTATTACQDPATDRRHGESRGEDISHESAARPVGRLELDAVEAPKSEADSDGNSSPPTARALISMMGKAGRSFGKMLGAGGHGRREQGLRRLPAVNAGKRVKTRGLSEVSGMIGRLDAEKRYGFLLHLSTVCAITSITVAILMNEMSYRCLWHERSCGLVNPLKITGILLSFVQLLSTVGQYLVRGSKSMEESLMRLRSDSSTYFYLEGLSCFIICPPWVEFAVRSPFGGVEEVYRVENVVCALTTLRLITAFRSLRELLRIRDASMIFVASILRVSTHSSRFNIKFAMHARPVVSLLSAFTFFVVWLTYLTRIAELPDKCIDEGVEVECAYNVVNTNESHLYIRNTFWMVIVTVSTVGYGDLVPQTFFGRFFMGLVMMVGNIWTSLLLGIVVQKIQLTHQEKQMVQLVEHKTWRRTLERTAAVWIQRWWKLRSMLKRKELQAGLGPLTHSAGRAEELERAGTEGSLESEGSGGGGHVTVGGRRVVKARRFVSHSFHKAHAKAKSQASRARDKFMPGVRAAKERFAEVAAQSKNRLVADTTLPEVQKAVVQLDIQVGHHAQHAEERFKRLETLLLNISDTLQQSQR